MLVKIYIMLVLRAEYGACRLYTSMAGYNPYENMLHVLDKAAEVLDVYKRQPQRGAHSDE